MDSARNQVLFALMIIWRNGARSAPATVRQWAALAFPPANANNGLMVTGERLWLQRLPPQLLPRCWKDILATTPREEQLARMKSPVYADDGFAEKEKPTNRRDYASADDFAGALFFP